MPPLPQRQHVQLIISAESRRPDPARIFGRSGGQFPAEEVIRKQEQLPKWLTTRTCCFRSGLVGPIPGSTFPSPRTVRKESAKYLYLRLISSDLDVIPVRIGRFRLRGRGLLRRHAKLQIESTRNARLQSEKIPSDIHSVTRLPQKTELTISMRPSRQSC